MWRRGGGVQWGGGEGEVNGEEGRGSTMGRRGGGGEWGGGEGEYNGETSMNWAASVITTTTTFINIVM